MVLAAFAITAAARLLGVPIGGLLDLATPALFAGRAIGRIGRFFAGCCVGRPTNSRWGLWSSDRRLGTRRIPTQFLESGLAAVLALVTLAVVATRRPNIGGLLFVAAVAVYTLCRQPLLGLRAEPRRTRLGTRAMGAAAAITLLAALVGLRLG